MTWMMPEMLPIPAFSNQYRYHATCAILPNRAFSGEAGILGRDSRGVPDGPSLRTVAGAMPNQTCVTGREPRPSPSANRLPG
jgi:hypothetical protein